jgi:large subunit ribosomal protein L21
MFAIVQNGGKQYRVEPGQEIVVDRMAGEAGDTVTLDDVLLVAGEEIKVGAPTVDGASVEARIVDHFKGEKKVTFKYRARHRYRRRVGFRHSHTRLAIVNING